MAGDGELNGGLVTPEELLLAGAVKRHGTGNWSQVSAELQNRAMMLNVSPAHFSPEACKSKYETLAKRYSGTVHSAGVRDNVPWFEEIRQRRVAHLKREVERFDGSIGSLKLQLKRLKAEKDRKELSFKAEPPFNKQSDVKLPPSPPSAEENVQESADRIERKGSAEKIESGLVDSTDPEEKKSTKFAACENAIILASVEALGPRRRTPSPSPDQIETGPGADADKPVAEAAKEEFAVKTGNDAQEVHDLSENLQQDNFEKVFVEDETKDSTSGPHIRRDEEPTGHFSADPAKEEPEEPQSDALVSECKEEQKPISDTAVVERPEEDQKPELKEEDDKPKSSKDRQKSAADNVLPDGLEETKEAEKPSSMRCIEEVGAERDQLKNNEDAGPAPSESDQKPAPSESDQRSDPWDVGFVFRKERGESVSTKLKRTEDSRSLAPPVIPAPKKPRTMERRRAPLETKEDVNKVSARECSDECDQNVKNPQGLLSESNPCAQSRGFSMEEDVSDSVDQGKPCNGSHAKSSHLGEESGESQGAIGGRASSSRGRGRRRRQHRKMSVGQRKRSERWDKDATSAGDSMPDPDFKGCSISHEGSGSANEDGEERQTTTREYGDSLMEKSEVGSQAETEEMSPTSRRLRREPKIAGKFQPLLECLRTICAHKFAPLFKQKQESQQNPEYDMLIRRHVDLGVLRTRLEEGAYSGSLEFFRDLLLIFNNALVYYSKDSQEYGAARVMRRVAIEEMDKVLQKEALLKQERPATRQREPKNSKDLGTISGPSGTEVSVKKVREFSRTSTNHEASNSDKSKSVSLSLGVGSTRGEDGDDGFDVEQEVEGRSRDSSKSSRRMKGKEDIQETQSFERKKSARASDKDNVREMPGNKVGTATKAERSMEIESKVKKQQGKSSLKNEPKAQQQQGKNSSSKSEPKVQQQQGKNSSSKSEPKVQQQQVKNSSLKPEPKVQQQQVKNSSLKPEPKVQQQQVKNSSLKLEPKASKLSYRTPTSTPNVDESEPFSQQARGSRNKRTSTPQVSNTNKRVRR